MTRLITSALTMAVLISLNGCGESRRETAPRPTPSHVRSQTAPPPTPTFSGVLISARVEGGKAQVVERRVRISLGQIVRLEITSDASDELHVHGYEKKAEVVAGELLVYEFLADIPGVFEIEMERARLSLVEIEVR